MKKLLLFLPIIFMLSTAAFAQTTSGGTKEEMFAWLQQKLIFCNAKLECHSPNGTISYKSDFQYSLAPAMFTLSNDAEEKYRERVYIGNMNANTLSWHVDEKNNLVLSIGASNGTMCLFEWDSRGTSVIKIVFDASTLSDPSQPNLQKRITDVFKKLIGLCGGTPEMKDKF